MFKSNSRIVIMTTCLFMLVAQPVLASISDQTTLKKKIETNLEQLKILKQQDEPILVSPVKELKNTYKLIEEKSTIEQPVAKSDEIIPFSQFRTTYKKDVHTTRRSIQQVNSINRKHIDNRRILLQVNEGETVDFAALGVVSVPLSERMEEQGYALVQIPAEVNFETKLEELSNEKGISMAEPDFEREITFTPVDPNYSKQWYLNNIDMPKAWDITKGSPDVTIAVLDTGVNRDHPDLKDRILPGYDFVNDDDNPEDDHGHGTHIAGIIAANANDQGITGVDLNAKILPVKVANTEGKAAISDVVEGIHYAIEQGADIINMSYGTYEYSSTEDDALWEAYDAGIVLLAAAGNDNSSDLSYPAAYTPVISVASKDKEDKRSSFSNFGNTIDITAPGNRIYSTNNKGEYEYQSGTSFSTPIVSGVTSLLVSKYPDWGPAQIEWALESSATQRNGLEWDIEAGYGSVHATNALTASLPSLENDVPDTKETAQIITSENTYQEKIDLPMDVDWYTFDVEQRGNLTIHLANVPSHLDLVGVLYHHVGDEVVNQYELDNGDLGNEEQITINAQPGTYYLAVYDIYNHWASSPYKVTVNQQENIMNDLPEYTVQENEPNDTIKEANKIAFGSVGTGHFQQEEDNDVFKMELPFEGDVVITTAVKNTAIDNDPVAYLAGVDEELVELKTLDYRDDGELKYNFLLFEDITPGTYYVTIANLTSHPDKENPYLFDVSYVDMPIPRASMESGTYDDPIQVKLATHENATIIYTTDGSIPTHNNGHVYKDPIDISRPTELKAISVYNNVVSDVVTFSYDFSYVFPDVTAYVDQIKFLTGQGIIKGFPDGTFKPTKPVTRLQAVQMILNEMGVDLENSQAANPQFKDMKPGDYGYKAAAKAYELGFIKGTVNHTFDPNGYLTRGQMAAILTQAYQLEGNKKLHFTDIPKNHWAYDVVDALASNEIAKGYPDQTFRPNEIVSRQHFSVFLFNYLTNG